MSSEKTKIEQPLERSMNEKQTYTPAETVLAPTSPAEGDSQMHPDWSKIQELEKDSLEARWLLEKYPVIRELWRSQVRMTTYYMSAGGGKLSMAEAIKRATAELGEKATEEEIKFLASRSVDAIDWDSIDRIYRSDPDYGQLVWEDIKGQALVDFKSGHYAAELFEGTDLQKSPWTRAKFVVVFQEMVEEYKPRGAIEHSMVQMVAVQFFLWHYWTKVHMQRATTEPRRESYDYEQWRKDRRQAHMANGFLETKGYSGQFIAGAWDVPYQTEAAAVLQALEMADRCRRAFHASVRALRDWRRYNVPVTINNPQQVNIAAEGGRQVNVKE
jgi:hypothetical protein